MVFANVNIPFQNSIAYILHMRAMTFELVSTYTFTLMFFAKAVLHIASTWHFLRKSLVYYECTGTGIKLMSCLKLILTVVKYFYFN